MNKQASDKKNKRSLTRLVLSFLIVSFALVLLVYGVSANSIKVSPLQDEKQSHLVLTEPQVVRDVTVGGLIRLDSGIIQRTYSGKPPQACPT